MIQNIPLCNLCRKPDVSLYPQLVTVSNLQKWIKFIMVILILLFLLFILIVVFICENCDSSHTNVSTINPYSAGIDFSRQNLTSVDVRF